jgi:hypothetical protein
MHIGFVGANFWERNVIAYIWNSNLQVLTKQNSSASWSFAGHRIPKIFIIVATLITNVTVLTFTFFKECLTFCAIKDTFDTALLEVLRYCVCRVSQTLMSFLSICNPVSCFIRPIDIKSLSVPSFNPLIHECFEWFINPWKTEFLQNSVWKLSLYLTGNPLCLSYTTQLVNAV